jgi:cytoskeletal protein CcmA (bactofilin family)
MCKRCSSYIDLQDYTVNQAVSKNFRTKGRFIIEPKGYVFNTTVVAGDVVIKGRLIGKVIAERSLTIYSTAEIKGAFQTALLVIPENNCFHCREPLHLGGGDVQGELVGASGGCHGFVRSKGRLFGNVQAQNLVVKPGPFSLAE